MERERSSSAALSRQAAEPLGVARQPRPPAGWAWSSSCLRLPHHAPLTPVPCLGRLQAANWGCSGAGFVPGQYCPPAALCRQSRCAAKPPMAHSRLTAASDPAALGSLSPFIPVSWVGSAGLCQTLAVFWAAAGAAARLGKGSPRPTCSCTQAPLYLRELFVMARSRSGQITDLAAACLRLRSSA